VEFDERTYLREMEELLESARAAFLKLPDAPAAYTISVWTDPEAGISTVSVDTAEHSAQAVAKSNVWSAQQRESYLSAGNERMADLFRPIDRNTNPADFRYRELVTCVHAAFTAGWESESGGQCWDQLEPVLLRVATRAAVLFGSVPLALDATLAVNSRRDWFDATVPLSARAG
jgi:hypothetical protein